MVVGGIGAAVGATINIQQFAFSWLLAFMFCLSLCVGAWFMVMVHHLFDASWSVPTRRYLRAFGLSAGYSDDSIVVCRLPFWQNSFIRGSVRPSRRIRTMRCIPSILCLPFRDITSRRR